jgi:hypothetical protein
MLADRIASRHWAISRLICRTGAEKIRCLCKEHSVQRSFLHIAFITFIGEMGCVELRPALLRRAFSTRSLPRTARPPRQILRADHAPAFLQIPCIPLFKQRTANSHLVLLRQRPCSGARSTRRPVAGIEPQHLEGPYMFSASQSAA